MVAAPESGSGRTDVPCRSKKQDQADDSEPVQSLRNAGLECTCASGKDRDSRLLRGAAVDADSADRQETDGSIQAVQIAGHDSRSAEGHSEIDRQHSRQRDWRMGSDAAADFAGGPRHRPFRNGHSGDRRENGAARHRFVFRPQHRHPIRAEAGFRRQSGGDRSGRS